MDQQSHSGVGSYLRDLFITRKAWSEGVRGHESIVAKLDNFYGESDESRKLREERPAPRSLSSNGSVLTKDGSRVSMIKNPLRYFPLVDVFREHDTAGSIVVNWPFCTS
jgi:hypothetical protein